MDMNDLEMENLTPDAEKIAVWRGMVIEALRHINENMDKKASQEALENLKEQLDKCLINCLKHQDSCDVRFDGCVGIDAVEKLETRVKSLEDGQQKTVVSHSGILIRLGLFGALGGSLVTIIALLIRIWFEDIIRRIH